MRTERECTTPDCATRIPADAGSYYCDQCVAEQMADAAREREAFDAYHAFADRTARQGRERERDNTLVETMALRRRDLDITGILPFDPADDGPYMRAFTLHGGGIARLRVPAEYENGGRL